MFITLGVTVDITHTERSAFFGSLAPIRSTECVNNYFYEGLLCVQCIIYFEIMYMYMHA